MNLTNEVQQIYKLTNEVQRIYKLTNEVQRIYKLTNQIPRILNLTNQVQLSQLGVGTADNHIKYLSKMSHIIINHRYLVNSPN